MRKLRKSPPKPEARTFRPNQLFHERDQLLNDIATAEASAKLKVKSETGDITKFLIDYRKLYFYGGLNPIRSSRKLKRETKTNLEVMWLLRGLAILFTSNH